MSPKNARQIARLHHYRAADWHPHSQMARELLLAQSSDWAFILTNDTTAAYATRRFKDHIRFTALWEQLIHGVPQHQTLEDIEWRNSGN